MHAPATVDEFKLSSFHQRFGQRLLLGSLLVPPSCKEPNFNVDEFPVGIFREPRDDSVDNVVNVSEKVLVNSDLPASVVVRVRNQVDVDLACISGGGGEGGGGGKVWDARGDDQRMGGGAVVQRTMFYRQLI